MARLWAAFWGFHRIRRIPRSPRAPLPPGPSLSVLWVGHSTVLLRLGTQVFLTDPIWSRRALLPKRFVEPGLALEDLPPLDAVIVSHVHFDHLDRPTLRRLPKGTPLVLPEGGAPYVRGLGYADVRELRAWSTTRVGDTSITAVPVRHFAGRYGFDRFTRPRTYTGYVLTRAGVQVFFAGDTAYHPRRFREIAARFPALDLALLPIGAYLPRRIMRGVHANPPEALRIFEDSGARHLVPIHHSTFALGAEPLGEPPAWLRRLSRERGIEERVHVLLPGELWCLEAPPPPAAGS